MNSLTIIIPVSAKENVYTVQKSIYALSNCDYTNFDERIVYCIDVPKEGVRKYYSLNVPENVELLFVFNNQIKQAGAYNAGIEKYPDSQYFAFFDVDAIPNIDFFVECLKVNADFVTSDRHISNANINSITKTISEETEMSNDVRYLSDKYIGRYFTIACTGLISGRVFKNFRFTERTAADNELYRYLVANNFTFGYTRTTSYTEKAVWTFKELWYQRLRWTMDAWRISRKHSSNGLYDLATMIGVLFPSAFILAAPLLFKHIKHIRGYNVLWHLIFSHIVSLVALLKILKGDTVKWKVSKK